MIKSKKNQDWKGTENSIFVTNGCSSHSQTPRQIHDFYATDPQAIDGLLNFYQLPNPILEPCCGNGSFLADWKNLDIQLFQKTCLSMDLEQVELIFCREIQCLMIVILS
jgi:hypothetical protein